MKRYSRNVKNYLTIIFWPGADGRNSRTSGIRNLPAEYPFQVKYPFQVEYPYIIIIRKIRNNQQFNHLMFLQANLCLPQHSVNFDLTHKRGDYHIIIIIIIIIIVILIIILILIWHTSEVNKVLIFLSKWITDVLKLNIAQWRGDKSNWLPYWVIIVLAA